MVPGHSITLTGTIPVEQKKYPLAVNGAAGRNALWRLLWPVGGKPAAL